MTAPARPASPAPRLAAADRAAVLAAAREVAANGRDLQDRWIRRLRAAGTVCPPPGGLPEQSFLAPGGGYRIPASRVADLSAAARELFAVRPGPDGWACLRGYGYYSADAVMYLPGRAPSARERWKIIADRWPRYAGLAAALAPQAVPVPWAGWLAWLSLCEAVINDLAAAEWTALSLGCGQAARLVWDALADVSGLLAEAAWHLWNDTGRARPGTWAARMTAATASPELRQALASLGRRLEAPGAEPHAVRAVREGDITWQACAAYETCWPAIRAAHADGRFVVVSEAFGALAAGPLWAGLMPAADRDATGLAVSRGSVHEEEMRRVPRASWRGARIPAGGRVVVHVDDGVFTGRTHQALREVLDGEPEAVYLAPLTLDVSTAVNHPGEITSLGTTIAAHMNRITGLARTPSGKLPAAASMWARRKRPSPDPAASILGGSDRQLAALWHRYAEDIHAR